jgi:hypothetical protein
MIPLSLLSMFGELWLREESLWATVRIDQDTVHNERRLTN